MVIKDLEEVMAAAGKAKWAGVPVAPVRRFQRLIGLVCIALLPFSLPLPAPAAAEEVSPMEAATQGLRRLGRLYWKGRIRLKDAGYDSNVYYTEGGVTGAYTATLSPGLDLVLPVGRRQILRGAGDLDLVTYGISPPGSYLNTAFHGGYELHLRRLHFSLGQREADVKARPNSEIDLRVRQRSSRTTGEAMIQVSPRVEAGLTYGLDRIRYLDEEESQAGSEEGTTLGDILDRRERRQGVKLRYAALPRTTFLLRAEETDYDFRDPLSTRQSRETRLLGGAEFDPSGVFSGQVELGVAHFQATMAEEQDFQGVLGNVGVTWRLRPGLHLRIEGARDRKFSTFAENLYYLSNDYETRFSFRLGEVTWVDVGHLWIRNTYPVENVNVGTEEQPQFAARLDRIGGPILGLRVQTGEAVTVGVEGQYRNRRSNFADPYERLFVSFFLQLER